MGLLEISLIAIGLSMDALAVAMCKGLGMRQLNRKHAVIIALFFGGFQALMPLIGWFLGRQFEQYIDFIDHWIAFVLLLFIGGRMIWNVFKKEASCDVKTDSLSIKELLTLALATSIDALTVGVTLGFLETSILPAISMIGITTFILSYIGVIAGSRFGARFSGKAELIGGIVLVLIGTKILLEHLGIIQF